MIKKQIEKMRRFVWNDKAESYSANEVAMLLEQHQKFIVSEMDPVLEADFQKLASEKESLTQANTKLQSEFDEIKSEKDNFAKQVEELTNELKPVREEIKAKTAKELFTGKVVTGAEADVYASIDLEGMDEAEDKEKFVEEKLIKLFEAKPYLKPIVKEEEINDGQKEILEEELGTKEKPEEVVVINHQDFGYNG